MNSPENKNFILLPEWFPDGHFSGIPENTFKIQIQAETHHDFFILLPESASLSHDSEKLSEILGLLKLQEGIHYQLVPVQNSGPALSLLTEMKRAGIRKVLAMDLPSSRLGLPNRGRLPDLLLYQDLQILVTPSIEKILQDKNLKKEFWNLIQSFTGITYQSGK